jgi:vacuolar-type H+-ATPase subunit F/Vma7
MIVSGELFLRYHKQLPSINDDLDLWSYWRSRIYDKKGINKIVIIGDSRGQLGIVPAVINREFTELKAVMLAIDGSGPYATLKHLANDNRFSGVVLCNISATKFFDVDSQQEWGDFYDTNWTDMSKYGKTIELMLRAFFQKRITLLSANLSLKSQMVNHFVLEPSYIITNVNRYRSAYYFQIMSPEQLVIHKNRRIKKDYEKYKKQKKYTVSVFGEHLKKEIAPLVRKIQERGGDVIFLKMPSESLSAYKEDVVELHPKDEYWNKIEKLTGAKTIHFKENGYNLGLQLIFNDFTQMFRKNFCISCI